MNALSVNMPTARLSGDARSATTRSYIDEALDSDGVTSGIYPKATNVQTALGELLVAAAVPRVGWGKREAEGSGPA